MECEKRCEEKQNLSWFLKGNISAYQKLENYKQRKVHILTFAFNLCVYYYYHYYYFILFLRTGTHHDCPRLDQKLQSSCLSLSNAGITGLCHCARMPFTFKL
jgi:hypothetical protein